MTPNKSKRIGVCRGFVITERLTGTWSANYVARDKKRIITSTDLSELVKRIRGESVGVK